MELVLFEVVRGKRIGRHVRHCSSARQEMMWHYSARGRNKTVPPGRSHARSHYDVQDLVEVEDKYRYYSKYELQSICDTLCAKTFLRARPQFRTKLQPFNFGSTKVSPSNKDIAKLGLLIGLWVMGYKSQTLSCWLSSTVPGARYGTSTPYLVPVVEYGRVFRIVRPCASIG
jgi:hypothetical protein